MMGAETPRSWDYHVSEMENGEVVLQLQGTMNAGNASSIIDKLRREIKKRSSPRFTLDLAGVTYFDDFGALVVFEAKNEIIAKNAVLKIASPPSNVREILSLVNFDATSTATSVGPKRKRNNIVSNIGDATLTEIADLKELVEFIGSVAMSFLHVCRHPKSLRIGDTITAMEKTGVNALPIVGMISFLLGLVIAFMSSLQLQQFGANIFVASLVAIAMVSELGPIMTAIVVAGRSGSAFAAEIGTMKISEEIDALVIMGFDPILFIAVPRIIASIIVVPVLTLFADLFAIAGGLVVGVFILDLTPASYITKTIEALTLFEICWGLSKSFIFAVLIVLVGCIRGFQTRGGADAVGNSATSAVVTSMFFIILFDSFFAVARSFWQ